jgi:hypothetical protein
MTDIFNQIISRIETHLDKFESDRDFYKDFVGNSNYDYLRFYRRVLEKDRLDLIEYLKSLLINKT